LKSNKQNHIYTEKKNNHYFSYFFVYFKINKISQLFINRWFSWQLGLESNQEQLSHGVKLDFYWKFKMWWPGIKKTVILCTFKLLFPYYYSNSVLKSVFQKCAHFYWRHKNKNTRTITVTVFLFFFCKTVRTFFDVTK
jgi:hypothetical protein